jgi:hypothetical protein
MDSPCFQGAVQPSPWAVPRGDERGAGYGRARTKLRRLQKRPSAHELQGQIASFPCFDPVPPCYRGEPSHPRRTPGAPVSCFSPVGYGQITGAGLCPVSCFSPVIYRDLQASRREPHPSAATRNKEALAPILAGGPCARAATAARAIPGRAGTGRPRRRSRRVRWRRSPPPCGRRARARGRRAPPADYWALPSPRRGEARARSPIHRAAG